LARARAVRSAQSPAGSPRRGRANRLARSESTGILGCRLDSTCRAARTRGSAADDQLSSGHDWSKSSPGSSSHGRSEVVSSRGNSAGTPLGSPNGGAREGMWRHSRIRRATSGSMIAERIRIRPPHAGQRSASTSKSRCRRSAQAMRPVGGMAGATNAGSRARASVGRCWAAIDRSRPKSCGSGQRNDVGAVRGTSIEAVVGSVDPRR
jgi:hypothetical protein